MSEQELIKQIRAEIFSLAQQSPSLEVMGEYMALANCFENDEFGDNEVEHVYFWMMALNDKKEYLDYLFELLKTFLRLRDSIKGRRRNE
jgi:hypothetical protein